MAKHHINESREYDNTHTIIMFGMMIPALRRALNSPAYQDGLYLASVFFPVAGAVYRGLADLDDDDSGPDSAPDSGPDSDRASGVAYFFGILQGYSVGAILAPLYPAVVPVALYYLLRQK